MTNIPDKLMVNAHFFDGADTPVYREHGKGRRPYINVTPEMLNETYKKYPETQLNLQSTCKKPLCNRRALISDFYCLKHTKKDFTGYDIPWMCQGSSRKYLIRCTNKVLEGFTFCPNHDPDKVHSQKKFKDGIYCGEDLLRRNERIQRAKEALRSRNLDDWVYLNDWECQSPRDLLFLMQETTNRLRMGVIPIPLAESIASMSKRMLDIMITEKEMGWLNLPTIEAGNKLDKEIDKVKSNVISFKEKLDQAVKERQEKKAQDLLLTEVKSDDNEKEDDREEEAK